MSLSVQGACMKPWALHKTECGGSWVYSEASGVEHTDKTFKVVIVCVRNVFHLLKQVDT